MKTPNGEKYTQELYTLLRRCLDIEQKGENSLALNCYRDVLGFINTYKLPDDPETKTLREGHSSVIGSKIEALELNLKKPVSDTDSAVQELTRLGVRYVEKPKMKLSEIAGLSQLKKTLLINVVYPIRFRELSKEFNIRTNSGVLLYGPPGNGKTMLGEAIAGEADIGFIEINPAYLYNEYFGKFEKNISRIFEIARKLSPNIIFFDEIDTLIPRREQADLGVVKRGITQLLIEVNKLMVSDDSGIHIIAATNLPWDLDPAMLRPGRFDLKLYVPPPDMEGRREILRSHISKGFFDSGIDVEGLSKITEGFSGAELDYVCRKASENVFYEAVKDGTKRPIGNSDLRKAIKETRPAATPELISRYQAF